MSNEIDLKKEKREKKERKRLKKEKKEKKRALLQAEEENVQVEASNEVNNNMEVDEPVVVEVPKVSKKSKKRKHKSIEEAVANPGDTSIADFLGILQAMTNASPAVEELPVKKKSKKEKKEKKSKKEVVVFVEQDAEDEGGEARLEAKRLRKKARKALKEAAKKELAATAAAAAAAATVEREESEEEEEEVRPVPPKKKSRKSRVPIVASSDEEAMESATASAQASTSRLPPSTAATFDRISSPPPTTKRAKAKKVTKKQEVELDESDKSEESTEEEEEKQTQKNKKNVSSSKTASKDAVFGSWVTLKKARDLALEHGFEFREGKFSKPEDTMLSTAITTYQEAHEMSQAEIIELIVTTRTSPNGKEFKKAHPDFWNTLLQSVPARPMISVYNHVKRVYDTRSRKGVWTKKEDDLLIQGIKQHGKKWSTIGETVDRLPGDCKDRWNNILSHRDNVLGDEAGEEEEKGKKSKKKKSKGKEKEISTAEKEKEKGKGKGAWTEREEEELRKLFKKYGKNWITIAKEITSRTRAQCRAKWRDLLGKESRGESHDEIRSLAHRYNLLCAVSGLSVADTTQIDWGQLAEDTQDKLKAQGHQLRKQWIHMAKWPAREGIDDHPSQVKWIMEQYTIKDRYGKAILNTSLPSRFTKPTADDLVDSDSSDDEAEAEAREESSDDD